MKFTLSWLKEHLDTTASLNEITERLTSIGLEVEDVDTREAFNAFVIAKVVSAQRHPDADKLQVLSVDTGDGKPLQVVCGAPNARAGLIGVFGRPGAYVPGLDVTLAVGKIRGVESFGMMCSERELLLSNEHNGIIDLPEDAPIGSSFASYAGLDDPIIDVSITPNRPDCTGVRGIARDLAASGLGTLKPLNVPDIQGSFEPSIDVSLDFADQTPLCLGFSWVMVKNVKNTQSPQWMQKRLTAIGLRSINAAVDMTNYITFDLGRPLHVFDADKVKGNLTVRRAKDGETIIALDGKTYDLNNKICVIADSAQVESIAGVMGGEDSGVDENTTNIIIESALWDPRNIAMTGRELGIVTDARYRFERGVDPEFMVDGLKIATQLLTDMVGGTPSTLKTTGYEAADLKVVTMPFSEIKRLTSLDVSKEQAAQILESLGFKVAINGESANVTVPSWRPDIDGKADLVEEVMRIYGIDKIVPTPLAMPAGVGAAILTTLQIRTRLARRSLAARGMMEAVTYSFISEKAANAFGGGDKALKLANPIASDMSDMRPSLLPGLLLAAQRNADRGFNDLALFEVSGTYQGDTADKQRRVAGGIRRGNAKLDGSGRFWSGNAKNVDVFDAKADALAVLDACGLTADKVQIENGGPAWYHPGRSGTIKLGPKVILGYFGEFHPETLETLDVSGSLCGFEVFIDAVPEPRKKPTKTKPALQLSPFQAVSRDFAFVVDKNVTAAVIIRAALGADKKLISGAKVFDIFEGASLGEDKKSVAIEVAIQPVERTLTDADFESLAKKIIDNVVKSTGGSLRA